MKHKANSVEVNIFLVHYYSEWPETRCSVATALQFCFRICHQKSKKRVGLKLNGTHQLLVYADDVNLLYNSTNTVKENTNTLRG